MFKVSDFRVKYLPSPNETLVQIHPAFKDYLISGSTFCALAYFLYQAIYPSLFFYLIAGIGLYYSYDIMDESSSLKLNKNTITLKKMKFGAVTKIISFGVKELSFMELTEKPLKMANKSIFRFEIVRNDGISIPVMDSYVINDMTVSKLKEVVEGMNGFIREEIHFINKGR
jgi:hypothetical protein